MGSTTRRPAPRPGARPAAARTARPSATTRLPLRRHLVGPVPALARAAAAVALLSAVAMVVASLLPYADVDGTAVRAAPPAVLAGLPWPLLLGAAGAAVLAGRLPRLGLAGIAVSGALAVGLLVTESYQLTAAGSHRAVEVFLGRRLVVAELAAGPGVRVALAAYVLLVLALALALAAWPVTTMEDVGDFDPLRPRALVLSAVAALAGALAVVAPTHTAPDQVLLSLSGLRTTIDVPADVALPERLGLDLLGGSLLAATVVLTALLAATLRPRLAAVGAYAALSAYLLGAALVALAEAGRYDDVQVGPGGWLLLVAGLAFGGVAGWALRARSIDGADIAAAIGRRPHPSDWNPSPGIRSGTTADDQVT